MLNVFIYGRDCLVFLSEFLVCVGESELNLILERVCLFDLICITHCTDSRGIEYDSLEQ